MANLTNDDNFLLIKTLRLEKGWSVLRIMREFLSHKWKKKSTLCNLQGGPKNWTVFERKVQK